MNHDARLMASYGALRDQGVMQMMAGLSYTKINRSKDRIEDHTRRPLNGCAIDWIALLSCSHASMLMKLGESCYRSHTHSSYLVPLLALLAIAFLESGELQKKHGM